VRARLAAQTASLVIACDPAATRSSRADHSVILVGAFHREGRETIMSVVDVWRGQVEVPELVVKLLNVQHRWKAVVGIESVGGFRGVGQMLRRVNGGLRVVELRASADKFTRAQPCAAAFARGAIQLPPSAPWLSTFLAEIASFTGTGADRHDDQVDTLVHAWAMAGIAGHAERCVRQRVRIAAAFPYG